MPSWLRRALAALPGLRVGPRDRTGRRGGRIEPVALSTRAFALTATAPSRDRIQLDWRIADGYYLYRQRISVQPDVAYRRTAPAVAARQARTMTNSSATSKRIASPDSGAAVSGAAERVTLKVKYQGCADSGCATRRRRGADRGIARGARRAAGTAGDGSFGVLARALGGGSDGPG